MKDLYYYKATVVKVKDGDTIVCDIDVGFGMSYNNVTCRFNGYNAPESRGREKKFGKIATQAIKVLEGNEIIIKTTKTGSFGRWLVDIYIPHNGRHYNLIDRLVKMGYGVRWDGKGKRPKFDLRRKYPSN